MLTRRTKRIYKNRSRLQKRGATNMEPIARIPRSMGAIKGISNIITRYGILDANASAL